MFKQILLIAVAIASVSANLGFQNCGLWNWDAFIWLVCVHLLSFLGSASQIHALRIRGCNAVPCTFVRGQDYYGEMDVTAGMCSWSRLKYIDKSNSFSWLMRFHLINKNSCWYSFFAIRDSSNPWIPNASCNHFRWKCVWRLGYWKLSNTRWSSHYCSNVHGHSNSVANGISTAV